MTDITRLQAIDALIALDHPEWERDGDEPRYVQEGEHYLSEWNYDRFKVEEWRMNRATTRMWYVLRRKRPATVTLTDVPIEAAETMRASNATITVTGADADALTHSARRALEALEKGEA